MIAWLSCHLMGEPFLCEIQELSCKFRVGSTVNQFLKCPKMLAFICANFL